ncbi:hypothetical protein BCR34DRAFT_593566 [Clohesyomyces aquaticus]|uniref:Uncharacterized protein n=1 Tax=Clohesyomyces aquaticus TaxID=1231657 RepID=A0A1Y1YGQ9_9PLEO|nr:hypothetical protein BCR34DRAFT_593566 [Clohesyomyces aquaticus]
MSKTHYVHDAKVLQTRAFDKSETWLPEPQRANIDLDTYCPVLLSNEIEKERKDIQETVEALEKVVKGQNSRTEKREHLIKDLEDARVLLRAADLMLFGSESQKSKAKAATEKADIEKATLEKDTSAKDTAAKDTGEKSPSSDVEPEDS